MPRVTRARTIGTNPDRVWDLVSDPHSMPRWWPRTRRVESVEGKGVRSRWTAVLETDKGSTVRADFRCTQATSGKRFAFSQDIAGTPFERVLREASVEILIAPETAGTSVSLTSVESLRGMARLGGAMMRSAARRRLDEALTGIERALVGG
ncbi:MAG: SRPBCC family protein [Actinomycetota bacterium]|nr:SRPBCC family protein [Actinomycetota bacterium]